MNTEMVDEQSISRVLKQLAQERPMFHSEADFQFELAWKLGQRVPNYGIRLEVPLLVPATEAQTGFGKRMALDLVLSGPRTIGIELKYHKAKLSVDVEGEKFRLPDAAARDVSRYGFLKDIQRLECLVGTVQLNKGYAIILSNDARMWLPPPNTNITDIAFVLTEGRTVGGTLKWPDNARTGYVGNRKEGVTLARNYNLLWREYSAIESETNGTFRYLLIEIGP